MSSFLWFVGLFLGLCISSLEKKLQPTPLRKEDENSLTQHPLPDRTLANYFVVTASLYVVSVVTVYKTAAKISSAWFFGLVPPFVIQGTGHLLFGVISGALLGIMLRFFLCPFSERVWYGTGPRIFWFFTKFIIKRSDQSLDDLELVDEFDPQSNINYLRHFLELCPNKSDQESLAFWEARKNSMEAGTLNYRVTLNGTKATELIKRPVKRLPIEFWKTSDGGFEIRIIEPENAKYRELSQEERSVFEPLVQRWYRALTNRRLMNRLRSWLFK